MTLLEKSPCVQQFNTCLSTSEAMPSKKGEGCKAQIEQQNQTIKSRSISRGEKYLSTDADPTFRELFRLWTSKRGHKKGHYKNSEGRPPSFYATHNVVRKRLKPFMDTAVNEFRYSQLNEIQEDWIEEGKAASTVNKYVGAVKMLLNFGESHNCPRTEGEFRKPNTLAQFKKLKSVNPGQNKVKMTYDVESVPRERVLKLAATIGSPYREILKILVLTTMRSGELLLMKPSDIDYESLKEKGLWVYTPINHKNIGKRKKRIILLNREVQEILNSLIPNPGKNQELPYFHHLHRGKFTGYGQKAMNKTIRSKAKALGIERFNLHQIRHLSESEVNDEHGIDAAAAVAGHSIEIAKSRYVDLPINTMIRVAESRTLETNHAEESSQSHEENTSGASHTEAKKSEMTEVEREFITQHLLKKYQIAV